MHSTWVHCVGIAAIDHRRYGAKSIEDESLVSGVAVLCVLRVPAEAFIRERGY